MSMALRSVSQHPPKVSAASPLLETWLLLVLTVGALAGIGIAAILLSRKDRAANEDPDAPLFI